MSGSWRSSFSSDFLRNINRAGVQEYYFSYNKAVAKEAGSVVSGICEFIRDELQIEPEICCHAHQIRDDHKWDPITRTASNPDTEALLDLIEGSKDLARRHEHKEKESMINENKEMDEDSKIVRERQRSMGITDGGETVENMTRPKKYNHKRIPHEVGSEHQSITSGISGITEYTSTSKASQERKSLRRNLQQAEANAQKLKKVIKDKEAETEKERKKIRELLKSLSTARISPKTLEAVQVIVGGQDSGESSADNSQSQEGERERDDEADIGLRFKLSQNRSYPPQGEEEEQDTSDEEQEHSEGDSHLGAPQKIRQKKVETLAKQGRIEFEPAPSESSSKQSEDSIDRWGTGEDYSPQRSKILTTKINEKNPVDLTKVPTSEEDDSSEESYERKERVHRQSTHLDSSDSESERSNNPKSKSITDQMINSARSAMTEYKQIEKEATGGEPGTDA